MTKSDDAALFELWRTKKDGDAFAELARRHAPVVFDLAARALGDRTAAEDVVQEALLDLALEPTRKPAEVGVVAWLARFAICRARNQRSSERCRTRRQQIVGLRRPEEAMPDDHLERKEELEHALAAAEPEERAVLAMRYLHGWEYDRIAQALSTSEGAARVRVHRALSTVRTRLGVDGRDEPKVARGMAAIALIPLPAATLDSAIRSALVAAGVAVAPLPVPGMRSALRAALQSFGAVALLAAAVTSVSALRRADLEPASRMLAGSSPAGIATESAAASSRAGVAAASSGRTAGSPRPENWDGGALARLARGDVDTGGAAPLPAPRPQAPTAREAAAAVPPVPAPAADDVHPSSAFRPSARGASAANCDSGSSCDERADALGGFARPVPAEPAPERAMPEPVASVGDPVVPTAPAPLRRVAARGRSFDALAASEQALVAQAAALVRDVVAQAAEAADAADRETLSRLRKNGVRQVRSHVREWRRHAEPGRPQLSTRKSAKIGRVLTILIEYVLSGGSGANGLRWPDGIDMSAALEDLIRVLQAVPQDAASRRPDIAVDELATEAAPTRRPELE